MIITLSWLPIGNAAARALEVVPVEPPGRARFRDGTGPACPVQAGRARDCWPPRLRGCRAVMTCFALVDDENLMRRLLIATAVASPPVRPAFGGSPGTVGHGGVVGKAVGSGGLSLTKMRVLCTCHGPGPPAVHLRLPRSLARCRGGGPGRTRSRLTPSGVSRLASWP